MVQAACSICHVQHAVGTAAAASSSRGSMLATNADDTILDIGFGMLLSHNMILYGSEMV